MYIIILTRKSIGNDVDDNASRIFKRRHDIRAAKPWEHKKSLIFAEPRQASCHVTHVKQAMKIIR